MIEQHLKDMSQSLARIGVPFFHFAPPEEQVHFIRVWTDPANDPQVPKQDRDQLA